MLDLFSESIVQAVQSISTPLLDKVFIGVTRFGGFYLIAILMLIIYYAIDKRSGFWIAILVSFSAYLNLFLKHLFSHPRPPDDLHKLDAEGFGVPSGHSQGSMTFYGSIGFEWKRYIPLFVGVIPILIGFSRIYLGVHYLTDVISGLAIGLAFISISYYFKDKIQNFFSNLPFWQKLVIPIIIFPTLLVINPRSMATKLMGMMLGWTLGYVIETKNVGFKPQNFSLVRRITNPIVALLIIMPLMLGIYLIEVSIWTEFPLNTGVGLVMTLGIPWILEKTR